jgi:hypothetical protein
MIIKGGIMHFRNSNDKLHYFGALWLTIIFYIAFLYFTQNWLLSLPLAIVLTNLCGFAFEALEHFVLPHWRNKEFWEGKPDWLRKHFSGDDWDWTDIKLNFLGSTIIHPLILLIGDKL